MELPNANIWSIIWCVCVLSTSWWWTNFGFQVPTEVANLFKKECLFCCCNSSKVSSYVDKLFDSTALSLISLSQRVVGDLGRFLAIWLRGLCVSKFSTNTFCISFHFDMHPCLGLITVVLVTNHSVRFFSRPWYECLHLNKILVKLPWRCWQHKLFCSLYIISFCVNSFSACY